MGTGVPEGEFDAVLLIDCWECFPDPVSTIRGVTQGLKPGGVVVVVTPNYFWRPLITFSEKIGLKKLAPAFGFGNSKVSVIRNVARDVGFQILKMPTFYKTLARGILLRKD